MPQLASIRDINLETPSAVFPSPRDWRDQFIYFLLVDRFDNNKNQPDYDPATAMFGRNRQDGVRFQGGTLKGIKRRLDYIKSLGCTAIWLSPVFKNRQERDDSYHGYGIQNFLELDPRFGTKKDLKDFVKAAHDKGLYVILDIIINHTGDNWAYPGGHPYFYWHDAPQPYDFGFWREVDATDGFQDADACWPIEFQNPQFYKRRGEIRNWHDHDESLNGDFLSLKELDIRRADVLSVLIQVYKYWIGFADIDGFRVDTVKHMEDSATAIFCNAIREYARRIGKDNFFIYGEIVGDDATLQRYLGRNTRLPGTNERFPSLNACLDFPLYFILEDVLKGFMPPQLLIDRYERFKTEYADHGESSRYFVTFIDNHDQMSRPYRRFAHQNPHPQQSVLAMAYLLTTQGVPCIYYGTEQGFDGGGDHDSFVRETMFGGTWGAFDTTGVNFFNSQHTIYSGIAQVAQIRQQQPALRYGRQYFREISGNGYDFGLPQSGQATLAVSRILDTEEVIVALNLEGSPRQDTVTVDANLTPAGTEVEDLMSPGSRYAVKEVNGRACVTIPLAGHQVAILKRQ